MSNLSPAAQAVLTAAWNAPEGRDSYRLAAAAAIRALVDECAYTVRYHPENSELNEMVIDASEAITIAAGLENHQ